MLRKDVSINLTRPQLVMLTSDTPAAAPMFDCVVPVYWSGSGSGSGSLLAA